MDDTNVSAVQRIHSTFYILSYFILNLQLLLLILYINQFQNPVHKNSNLSYSLGNNESLNSWYNISFKFKIWKETMLYNM